jgi:hypothetical protein
VILRGVRFAFIESVRPSTAFTAPNGPITVITDGTRYDERGNEVAAVDDFAAALRSQTVTGYDDVDAEISSSLVAWE